MRVLSLMGSPHKEGASARLHRAFMEGLGPCQHDIIWAYDVKVGPCIDCGLCKKTPALCSIKDDMVKIYELMGRADVIVVATPIYYNSLPAPFKAIVDRTMCLYCRRFIHGERKDRKKPGVLLISGGNTKSDDFTCVKSQLKMLMDVLWADISATVLAGDTDKQDGITKGEEQARILGQELARKASESQK